MISMITINARGLILKKDRSKIKQLEVIIKDTNAVIVVVTETWLDDSVNSAEICIKGYNLYRTDRDGREIGGSCIYIRSDIPSAPILQYSNSVVETTLIKVPTWELLFGSIYRPPDT